MSFVNRIRLPLKVTRPQFLEDREVYRKANGETVTLSSVVRKQYELETDLLPEHIHEKIKIALAHDNVAIEGDKYIGGIVADPEYNIAWPDFLDFPLAKASGKVTVTPFDASNTNCATCEEMSQVVAEDDNLGDISEGDDLNVSILDNDSICCNPFEISIVTFNADYVDSVDIVGNNLEIHIKDTVVTQNNVVLATYRVTCDNGQYDEADVIANVAGSEEGCLSPTDLEITEQTSESATFSWTAPDPAPDSYTFTLEKDGVPVDLDPDGTFDTTVQINDLEPGNYEFCVASVCGEGQSNFICISFTIFAEAENCGNYILDHDDGTGIPGNGTNISYLACDDEYHSVFCPNAVNRSICCKESSPGNPIYIQPHPNITVSYDSGNARGCGTSSFS